MNAQRQVEVVSAGCPGSRAAIGRGETDSDVTPSGREGAPALVHSKIVRHASPYELMGLLEALEQAVAALNTVPRFQVPSLATDSYRIAALCDRVIARAKPKLAV
jgi:hypothetical protein